MDAPVPAQEPLNQGEHINADSISRAESAPAASSQASSDARTADATPVAAAALVTTFGSKESTPQPAPASTTAATAATTPPPPPQTTLKQKHSLERQPLPALLPSSDEKPPAKPTKTAGTGSGGEGPKGSPPLLLRKTSSGSRNLKATGSSQKMLNFGLMHQPTGIPRLNSLRSRHGMSLRAMSMDSEAGGDELSALSSQRGDSSWDEYDEPVVGEVRVGSRVTTTSAATAQAATPPVATASATAVAAPRQTEPAPAPAADDEPVGFPPPPPAQKGTGWPLVDAAEDDSVLLGVSKMLMILKGHVSKTRHR